MCKIIFVFGLELIMIMPWHSICIALDIGWDWQGMCESLGDKDI